MQGSCKSVFNVIRGQGRRYFYYLCMFLYFMSMEQIRIVDPEIDAPEIADINAWYVENTTVIFDTLPLSEKEMRQKIEKVSERFPYFVYEKDGRVEGYCYAHPWKEKRAYYPTWETTIYMRHGCEGRGIGKLLMETLTETCREKGCHSLIACITAENEGSCRFHEKLGFKKVSFFKEVGEKFGRLLDVVDYQKII